MNWEIIEGRWDQFKGRVKQHWGRLTDSDLRVIDGKKDELAGKLQEKYGYAKDRAENAIRDFLKFEAEKPSNRRTDEFEDYDEDDFDESSIN